MGRGLSWTLTGEWTSYLVQIGTTMVLARLLTPEIFGVMAMALTLTVVVDQFRSLGLSQAVIQRPDLTWSQVNALFWVNMGFGALLAAIVAAGGPVLAAFYDEPRLGWLCAALGAGYLLSGAAVQHGALLTRKLAFRTISVRNVVARLLSSLAAVVAAVLGLGVWALVIQQVSLILFTCVVMWLAVPWRPRRPQNIRDAVPLVKFGSLVTVANLLHAVSRQADNVVVGRVLGADLLGLYSRAYGLLTLPLRQLRTPVSAVMVPTLSALQDEPVHYRNTYRHAVSGLAHAGMPLVVVLAVQATEVIDVFLGSQWTQAAPIFQLLAVAGFVQLISTTSGWLFLSFGRGGAAARWAVVSSVVTVASFLVGVRWGVNGVAAAYAIGQVVLTPPAFVVACRDTPVSPRDPLLAVLRPLTVSALVLAVTVTVDGTVPAAWPSLARLLVVGASAVATWVAVMAAWRGARAEVSGLLSVVRDKKGRA